MYDFIANIFQVKGAGYDFNVGYATGVGVVLAVLVLLLSVRLILAFIFRTRRCHEIRIKGEDGDVFVSRNAVNSVVNSLEKEFKNLIISKVSLNAVRKRQFINIYVDFNADSGGLPPQADELKRRVLEALETVFGITTVRKVHICLRNVQLVDVPKSKTETTTAPLADVV